MACRCVQSCARSVGSLISSVVPSTRSMATHISDNDNGMHVALGSVGSHSCSRVSMTRGLSGTMRGGAVTHSFIRRSSSFKKQHKNVPMRCILRTAGLRGLRRMLPGFVTGMCRGPMFRVTSISLGFDGPRTHVGVGHSGTDVVKIDAHGVTRALRCKLDKRHVNCFCVGKGRCRVLNRVGHRRHGGPTSLGTVCMHDSGKSVIRLSGLVRLAGNVTPPGLCHCGHFMSTAISTKLTSNGAVKRKLSRVSGVTGRALSSSFHATLAKSSGRCHRDSSDLVFTFVLTVFLVCLVLTTRFRDFGSPLVIVLAMPLTVTNTLVFVRFNKVAVGVFDRVNVVVLVKLMTGGNVLVIRFTGRGRRDNRSGVDTVGSTSLRHLHPVLVADTSAVLKLVPLTFTADRNYGRHVTVNATMMNKVLVSALVAVCVMPTVCDCVSAGQELAPILSGGRRSRAAPVAARGWMEGVSGGGLLVSLLTLYAYSPFLKENFKNRTSTRRICALGSYLRGKLRGGCSLHVVRGRRRIDGGGTAPKGTNCLPAVSFSTKCGNAISGARAGMHRDKRAVGRGNMFSRAVGIKLGLG